MEWDDRGQLLYYASIVWAVTVPLVALLGESENVDVPMNAVVLGMVLLACTALALFNFRILPELAAIGCGVYLAISPLHIRYESAVLEYAHIGLGIALALVGAATAIPLFSRYGLRRRR